MKIFTTVATMISLATGSSVLAQSDLKIQDQFHTSTVQACFERSDPVDRYLKTETEQRLLFRSMGIVNITDYEQNEFRQLALIEFYVDQKSGNFTILKIFPDGVTCVLTEGTGFEPYVD